MVNGFLYGPDELSDDGQGEDLPDEGRVGDIVDIRRLVRGGLLRPVEIG